MNKNKSKVKIIGLILVVVVGAGLALYQIPSIKERINWRVDIAQTFLRGVVHPVQPLPTAQPQFNEATLIPTATRVVATLTPKVAATPLPTPTSTPLPERIELAAPPHEVQGINNCGPATLSMYLNYYGWGQDQQAVADVLKPLPEDRNVNVEELDYFVKNYAGWLNTIYRVGGSTDLLKKLIAGGIPVMIEESSKVEPKYAWYEDDLWAGHYLLVTGYDDSTRQFIAQDSFLGANQRVAYAELDRNWQAFNRVFILIYLPEQEPVIQQILGDDWDADINRQNALQIAQTETESDPQNAFTWFNLGSNLVYFERYDEAAQAYDHARAIGWPQRMLRYQFGPFLAYFHSLRTEDLMAMVDYALERTPNSEEALLWQGWGLYREGKKAAALESFQKALEFHKGYSDALYALDYVTNN